MFENRDGLPRLVLDTVMLALFVASFFGGVTWKSLSEREAHPVVPCHQSK